MASSTKKKKVWVLIIAAVVLIAAAIGAWLYFHRPVEEEDSLKTVSLENASVGDIVLFGSYEQDDDMSNGEEQIAWDVWAKEDGKLLLVSHYGLENKQYNYEPAELTWEECSLRTWLNEDFYQGHFTDQEREKIALSHLTTEDNVRWGTDGGNDTDDYVFLLSTRELQQYTNQPLDQKDPMRETQPTAYAVANRAWYSGLEGYGKNSIFWWTRSPGPRKDCVACVMGDGVVMDGNQSCYVSQDHFSVRPALWLDLTK
ncbi:MAG: DUF6273 domain-containing protein [Clostridiales bacterium]|nr:DUF6273 domain-containing protein [Clostridiales bacterium]